MHHNFSASFKNILLRPLREEDIEMLRIWRNDPANTRFLRKIDYITGEMQKNWFCSYLDNPKEVAFAIVETQKLNRIVGSIAIYDLSEDSAEIGRFQIGDKEARGQGFGNISVALATRMAFECLGLKRVTASVHRENIASYKSFTKNGFKNVGSHESVVGGIEDDFERVATDFLPDIDYSR